MRPQPDLPRPPSRPERRRSGRGRSIVITFLVVLLFLLISLRGIAAFYTDFLWFDSLGLGGLWRSMLVTKAGLTFLGGILFFLMCWANLVISERLAPVFRPSSGDEDLIERYHEMIGRRAWVVRVFVALFLSLVVGVSLGAAWNEWVLFTNAVDWGVQDATFDTDIGFYVFRLPFLMAALSWLFSSLVVIFVVTVLAHIVNGGIRFHNQLDRVTPQVKAHLSVLLAVLALVQGVRYWFDHYALTLSTRGTVDGATYTDVNVTLRAYYLLILIALFATGLFIANIWRRGWMLPGMAVGLWLLVAVLAQGIIPAVVQRVRVEPTESTREREYIDNNIQATRQAYGLDVDGGDDLIDWTDPLSAADLQANTSTMDNVRLWDPSLIQQNFAAEQTRVPYFQIGDVDVDRYEVDGETRQVMLAARDANPSGASSTSWESTHLVYTNGYALVAGAGNDKTGGGDPVLLARDIPVRSSGLPTVEEPRIFFGEDSGGYVIVNTDVKVPNDEFADAGIFDPYEGEDGIEIGSGLGGFARKAAFSLRFGDIDPLLSGSIRSDSLVLMGRDVSDRVKALAPFLALDHDPYLVLTPNGRLQYVVDAYTTTRNFPNAQQADTGGLAEDSGLRGRSFNYIRNSVKAVVDAYDGTVTLYVVDQEDPLIRAYQKAFPDLFTPGDEMPADLKSHLRYPEDLFTVQSQMWTRYHVSDPDDFYKGVNAWAVPPAVGTKRQTGSAVTEVGPDGRALTDGERYQSQYVLLAPPGEREARFVLMRPFVTGSENATSGGQNQLRAFLTGAIDEETGLGELRQYVYDRQNPPDGPNLAAEDIQSDSGVAQVVRDQCTNRENNTCTFTSPTIVPVGDALLYVQSLAVAGKQQRAPQINYVIVNYVAPDDSQVEIATSLRGALVELFGDDVPTSIEDAGATAPIEDDEPSEPSDPGEPEEPGGEPGTVAEQEDELIDGIVEAFAAAEAAAAEGDLIGQATEIQRAGELARQLQELRQAQAGEVIEDEGTSGSGDGSTTTAPPTTEVPDTTTTTTAGA